MMNHFIRCYGDSRLDISCVNAGLAAFEKIGLRGVFRKWGINYTASERLDGSLHAFDKCQCLHRLDLPKIIVDLFGFLKD